MPCMTIQCPFIVRSRARRKTLCARPGCLTHRISPPLASLGCPFSCPIRDGGTRRAVISTMSTDGDGRLLVSMWSRVERSGYPELLALVLYTLKELLGLH